MTAACMDDSDSATASLPHPRPYPTPHQPTSAQLPWTSSSRAVEATRFPRRDAQLTIALNLFLLLSFRVSKSTGPHLTLAIAFISAVIAVNQPVSVSLQLRRPLGN